MFSWVFLQAASLYHQSVVAELVAELIEKLSDGSAAWWQQDATCCSSPILLRNTHVLPSKLL
jgi:hypothetical protein